MQDRRIHLKVKVKNLADEARVIRLEESRARDPHLRWSLWDHRRTIVRSAARTNLLAYGFLRGRPYKSMESKLRGTPEPPWESIRKLVSRFGVCRASGETAESYQERLRCQNERFDAWLNEAKR